MRDGKPLPGLSEMTALLPADAEHLHGPFQGRGRSLEDHPDLGEESGQRRLPDRSELHPQ